MPFSEPWYVEKSYGTDSDDDEFSILSDHVEIKGDVTGFYNDSPTRLADVYGKEFADRAVLCVNFCAGFSNEDLEEMISLKSEKEIEQNHIDVAIEAQDLLRALYKNPEDEKEILSDIHDYLVEEKLI